MQFHFKRKAQQIQKATLHANCKWTFVVPFQYVYIWGSSVLKIILRIFLQQCTSLQIILRICKNLGVSKYYLGKIKSTNNKSRENCGNCIKFIQNNLRILKICDVQCPQKILKCSKSFSLV